MKVFIFKAFLLLFIIIGALFYLSKFSVPNHRYFNTVNDYNSIINKKKDIDIAIYGSSHAYCSYNPRIIDSITKTRSFNFGNGGQHLLVSKYVLDETLKKTSPKLVVLDLFSPFLKRPSKEMYISLQTYNYYYFNFSLDKIRSVLNVFPSQNVSSVIFPGLNRKDFKYDFKLERNTRYKYPKSSNANPYRGYVGFNLKMKEKEDDLSIKQLLAFKNHVETSKKKYDKLTVEEKIDLLDFIEKVQLNGGEVLLVVSPYYDAFKVDSQYGEFYNFIMDLSESKNIKLLDFNMLWEKLNFNKDDFKDKSHLNLKGGNKVSKYLGEYIKENYNLPSRGKEKVWLEEQPLDLKTYIYTKYSNQKRKISFKMSKDLMFESFTIANVNTSKKMIIKLDNQVNDSILRKYKLGFHTFVSEDDKDNLTGYSKSKGRSYDAWDFDPEITEINHSKYIIKSLKTPINKFTKVQLFLYDRLGYKGVIGNKLIIDSVEIK